MFANTQSLEATQQFYLQQQQRQQQVQMQAQQVQAAGVMDMDLSGLALHGVQQQQPAAAATAQSGTEPVNPTLAALQASLQAQVLMNMHQMKALQDLQMQAQIQNQAQPQAAAAAGMLAQQMTMPQMQQMMAPQMAMAAAAAAAQQQQPQQMQMQQMMPQVVMLPSMVPLSSTPSSDAVSSKSSDEDLDAACSSDMVRVTDGVAIASVAASIAQRVKQHGEACVEATGAPSVATAMQAIKRAGVVLYEHGLCVTVLAQMVSGAGSKSVMAGGFKFMVKVDQSGLMVGGSPGVATGRLMSVDDHSDTNKTAGAIAARCRKFIDTDKSFVIYISSQALATHTAVKALTLSRRMLDGDCLDVMIRPIVNEGYARPPAFLRSDKDTLAFLVSPVRKQ